MVVNRLRLRRLINLMMLRNLKLYLKMILGVVVMRTLMLISDLLRTLLISGLRLSLMLSLLFQVVISVSRVRILILYGVVRCHVKLYLTNLNYGRINLLRVDIRLNRLVRGSYGFRVL